MLQVYNKLSLVFFFIIHFQLPSFLQGTYTQVFQVSHETWHQELPGYLLQSLALIALQTVKAPLKHNSKKSTQYYIYGLTRTELSRIIISHNLDIKNIVSDLLSTLNVSKTFYAGT